MKLKDLTSISKPKLILTEGSDDDEFLQAFVLHLGLADLEIANCEGNGKFDPSIAAIVKITGFSAVQKFGIICDAETDFSKTFKSRCGSISSAGLNAPSNTTSLSAGNPQVGIFTMPWNAKNGMLEDLCLESVSKHPAMSCVNAFDSCAKKLAKPPLNPSKSRAKAFLAAMPESVPHVGLAARKKYWDFTQPPMDDLRQFLSLYK